MGNNKITYNSALMGDKFVSQPKPKTDNPRTTGELMELLALYPTGTMITVNLDLLSIKSMKYQDMVLNIEI